MHGWLKDHKHFSDYYLKLPNALCQNGFYFYVMFLFVKNGSYSEAGFANMYFHALRNILIRWVAFDHPLENLEPGSAPLLPGQDPNAKSNDYYYSGHTGTAVLAFCMCIQYEKKPMQWFGFIFLMFTAINMTVHHGHYVLDIYIGAFTAFVAYIINGKTKFFWNYQFTRAWWAIMSQLFCCCLRKRILTEPIEKIVDDYRASHPNIQVDEFEYNIVHYDEKLEKNSKDDRKESYKMEVKDLEQESQ